MRLTQDTAAPDHAAELSPQEFAGLLDPLLEGDQPDRVAVACSGGPDSMALVWLAGRWAKDRHIALTALIVDHALRPESGAEAALTAKRLTACGIRPRILTRAGPPVTRNKQAEARAARYRLLASACAEEGIDHLLLAHHLDDQAETFLLRLARGSGVEGLAAMAPRRDPPDGPALLRPLLNVPKARLAACLLHAGLEAVHDPSNQDPSFARVRMRGLLPQLAGEGLTPERLAATAKRMAEAAEVLDEAARGLATRSLEFHEEGYALLAPDGLASAPRATRLRLIGRLLQTIGGGEYSPRLEGIERLDRDLASPFTPRTLAGCRLQLRKDGRLMVTREAAAAEACHRPLRPHLVWDGRFRIDIDITACPEGSSIRALGREGMRRLRQAGRIDRLDDPPGAARPALPALCGPDGEILEVPHLGYRAAGRKAAIRAISPRQPYGFRIASFSSRTRKPT